MDVGDACWRWTRIPLTSRAYENISNELHLDEPARAKWLRHWLDAGSHAVEEALARDPRSGHFCLRRSTKHRRYLFGRTFDQCQDAM
jgi:hypothetical protein